jgi:hypothetical protein
MAERAEANESVSSFSFSISDFFAVKDQGVLAGVLIGHFVKGLRHTYFGTFHPSSDPFGIMGDPGLCGIGFFGVHQYRLLK